MFSHYSFRVEKVKRKNCNILIIENKFQRLIHYWIESLTEEAEIYKVLQVKIT